MLKQQHTAFVKATAKSLGFDFCGLSEATFLEEEAPRLEAWLKSGKHGSMSYMEHYFDKRLDPRLLVPGAKSVVSLLYNYTPAETQRADAPQISKYAYGEDYHEVIREKLNLFIATLREKIGDIQGRGFVDSAPVLDKVWATRSGLGWMGKHTNLINKQRGSYFFIAELILDLALEYDGPLQDYCGTCTRCIDACPTDAIVAPYVVDGSKCISYLTIELKEAIPEKFQHSMQQWAFGCDVCQDVCPWNRFAEPHQEPRFNDTRGILQMDEEEWHAIDEATFTLLFRKSAIKRTKYRGLKRNLQFLKKA